jgi:hypothetical protein
MKLFKIALGGEGRGTRERNGGGKLTMFNVKPFRTITMNSSAQ